MRTLPSTHPDDFARLDTTALRDRFLVDGLFAAGEVRWAHADDDRLLLGGLVLDGGTLPLEAPSLVAADSLCQRRELAVVCLGGRLTVDCDGTGYDLDELDVLYVGRGTASVNVSGTGRAYLVSAPAHAERPTSLGRRDEVFAADLGSREEANVRTIRRYVHADGIASANLVLGITTLAPGSVWNTMPCHTHGRRTEVYLYTGLGEDGRVVHLAGPPDATRSIVVADGEAVVSPGWSVHTGVGTRAYSFVWAMAGENQDYADMQPVDVTALR
ncbi:5-dehydro-4-deoxy-D-glucuronate isomerase [Auraticoccus monumenti]|uniref:5-dehydro-4-deoxy-D-glucuronate isomerase n=1 Tax=Auraticoccus monumenti TaxID=675864 RepID=A0A1G6TGY5_9ACTN|nr:5-dehydro-4-deoxy-D-glucuronate isomerase [Auraticoccus monumenti]SDD28301.1 4-deoxy-L-threo-5-hexosulose-uronate ketol-isomerase [Auraticoccus monumenti]